MVLPIVVRIGLIWAVLSSSHAIAVPVAANQLTVHDYLQREGVSQSLVQNSRSQRPETSTLHFVIDLEVAGEQAQGELEMNYETFLNGSVLQLSSDFSSSAFTMPDKLPSLERVIKENGVVSSTVMSTPEDEVGAARMHTYSTFADLGKLVEVLNDRHSFGHIVGGDQQFQSAFLLLSKPASIRTIDIDAKEDGRLIKLAMSNDSVIVYQLDNARRLYSISINDGIETKVTYTVKSSLE